MLHLAPKLTFHDLRASGATWAFQHGVPLQQIMHHGTWKSDAIWSYIQNVPTASTAPTSKVWLFGGFLTSYHHLLYLCHLLNLTLPVVCICLSFTGIWVL